MKFPKIFIRDEEEEQKRYEEKQQRSQKKFQERQERKPLLPGVSIYTIATLCVIAMMAAMFIGFAANYHYTAPTPPPVVKGKMVAMLDNHQTSVLVGKITEYHNSSWILVSYPWSFNNKNVTLQEPTGQLDDLNNLAVGVSLDLVLRGDGTIASVDGVTSQ